MSNPGSKPHPTLLLPVENQVRELDAKLFLAILAAQKGYRSLFGWKGYVDFHVGRFGPSIYFAKSISEANTKMLRIKRKLGHFVIAWDEEALVRYPDEIYYARRIGGEAPGLIDRYVAWGDSNADVVRRYPDFDADIIRILGNPRADMLRPELRGFFDDRVAELNAKHGDFILINTNFGTINGYTDTLNLMRRDESGQLVRGRGSRRMPPGYPEKLYAYRTSILEGFQKILPELARAFPEKKIIIRPHPAENHDLWRQLGSHFDNIEVIAEGNVVPWLMAASALVHNNCTTAVEGFLLGTKIVTYAPFGRSEYDFILANELGTHSKDAEEIIEALRREGYNEEDAEKSREVARHHISSLEGKFATQRIVDLLEECRPHQGPGTRWKRVAGRVQAEHRAFCKRWKQKRGVARYGEEFRRQRFPKIPTETLRKKAAIFAAAVDGVEAPEIREHSEDLWEIIPRGE